MKPDNMFPTPIYAQFPKFQQNPKGPPCEKIEKKIFFHFFPKIIKLVPFEYFCAIFGKKSVKN